MRRSFVSGHANDLNQCIAFCCAWASRLKQYGVVSSIASLGTRQQMGTLMAGRQSVRGTIIRSGLSVGRSYQSDGGKRGVPASWIRSTIASKSGYYIISLYWNEGAETVGHSTAVRHGIDHQPDLYFDPNRGQWEGDDMLQSLATLLRPYLYRSPADRIDGISARCWCDVDEVS